MDQTEQAFPENGFPGILGKDQRLAEAFAEQVACMQSVYAIARDVIRPPSGFPPEYNITLGPIPDSFFSVRKNLFSTLFYSTYLALDIPLPRRQLYGKLNHLFRIWVTGADNLLDDEDKCVLPLALPGSSRVMREVVSIMAADRILWHLLTRAVAEGTITTREADSLSNESLRLLLPSAAQEASEESGVTHRPSPAYVLEVIHLLKTGLLFNIPFLGIDWIEKQIDPSRVIRLKQALRQFGGGCQILDDLRDMARDFIEHRHNYLLSLLERDKPEILAAWSQRQLSVSDRLYFDVPSISLGAARLALKQLTSACTILQEEQVVARGISTSQMAFSMLTALDLEDFSHECTVDE